MSISLAIVIVLDDRAMLIPIEGTTDDGTPLLAEPVEVEL